MSILMSSLWVLDVVVAGSCQAHSDQEHVGMHLSLLLPSTVVQPVTQKVSPEGIMSCWSFARTSSGPRSSLVIPEPQKKG